MSQYHTRRWKYCRNVGVADCKAFGSPWLLGTDKLIDTKKEFIPQAMEWVEKINNDYPLLLNYVHADNTVSKRWLKSLGFQFIDLIKEHGDWIVVKT